MHLKDCLKDLNPKDTISKEAVDVVLYNPGTGVNLTLVDLPGHVSRPKWKKEIVEAIFDEYCATKSTIILLVHDCSKELDNNPVQQLVQERYDSTFSRTFGVMTKMNLELCFNTSDVNTQKQAEDVMGILANEKDSPKYGHFSFPTYGWVGITGQDPRQLRDETIEQTRKGEKDFFDGDFVLEAGVPAMTKLAHAKPNKEEGNYGLGTDVFRNRLGNTLVANIKARLPEISAVIDNELKETRKRLEALGKPPPSDEAGRLEYINREIVQPWQYAIRSRLESDLRIRLQATFKGGQPPGGRPWTGLCSQASTRRRGSSCSPRASTCSDSAGA